MKIVLFGASMLAELAQYYLTHDSDFTVVAYTVDGEYVDRSMIGGLPVVPFEEVQEVYPPGDHGMLVAIGAHGVNQVRASKCDAARSKGYELISYICSKASTWPDLSVGPNTFIDQGATIHPFVRIGSNVVVISAQIGHQSILDDHCYIAAATLGGGVRVGECAFIGMNATVREHVSVGRGCIIGAGVTVLRDTKDDEVFRIRGTQAARAPSRRVRIMPDPKKSKHRP